MLLGLREFVIKSISVERYKMPETLQPDHVLISIEQSKVFSTNISSNMLETLQPDRVLISIER